MKKTPVLEEYTHARARTQNKGPLRRETDVRGTYFRVSLLVKKKKTCAYWSTGEAGLELGRQCFVEKSQILHLQKNIVGLSESSRTTFFRAARPGAPRSRGLQCSTEVASWRCEEPKRDEISQNLVSFFGLFFAGRPLLGPPLLTEGGRICRRAGGGSFAALVGQSNFFFRSLFCFRPSQYER